MGHWAFDLCNFSACVKIKVNTKCQEMILTSCNSCLDDPLPAMCGYFAEKCSTCTSGDVGGDGRMDVR